MEGLKRLTPQLKDLSEQITGEYLVLIPNGGPGMAVAVDSFDIEDGVFYGKRRPADTESDDPDEIILVGPAEKMIIYHCSLVGLRSNEDLAREMHADGERAEKLKEELYPDKRRKIVRTPYGPVEVLVDTIDKEPGFAETPTGTLVPLSEEAPLSSGTYR